MPFTQTRLIVAEYTCDVCGHSESTSAIEGVTPDGATAQWATPWRTISIELYGHTKKTPHVVCSKPCFLTAAEMDWDGKA